MKKIFMVAIDSAIPSLVLLLVLLFVRSTLVAQQQTNKGRWFIKHNVGGIEYGVDEQRSINSAGVLTSFQKRKGFEFSTALSGPNYGNLQYLNSTYSQMGFPDMKDKGVAIWLEPVAGIFIRDNFLLGASMKIDVDRRSFKGGTIDQRLHINTLGIGPFVRYYFKGTEKARFFGGLESRYSFSKDRTKVNTTTGADRYKTERYADETELIAIPHGGYAWFVGKRWSFELQVSYRYRTTTVNNTTKTFKNGVMQTGYPMLSEDRLKSSGVNLSAGIGFSL